MKALIGAAATWLLLLLAWGGLISAVIGPPTLRYRGKIR